MANFQTAIKKAQRLTPQKVKTDLFAFIRTLEEELAAYNRATLFEDSEDVDGKPIGFYSPGTEIFTDGRKKAGEPFDLKETGEFLESIFSKVQTDSIFFGATDPKLKDVLSNLLTNNIFGLQDDDLKRVLNERVAPFLIKYFRKEMI